MQKLFKDIYITEIIQKHFNTLQNKNKFQRRERNIYLIIPIIFSIILVFFFGAINETTANTYITVMSIFAGLLFNMLVLLITTIKTDEKHPDKKNRKKLLQESFYNLSYTVLLSITSIIFLLIQKINLPQTNTWFTIDFIINRKYNLSEIFQEATTFIAYIIFINVCFTIFSILYNIFKLFELDIKYLK